MTSSRDAGAGAATAKWLSIVGIGESGVAGLSEEAIACIRSAEIVFGGARHLDLAGGLIQNAARPWPSPFQAGIAQVLAARGRAVCVLASGDPFQFGVGATLARHVAADEMHVVPHPSAFSLAAARLGWPLQEVETLSLHGRSLDLLRPWLHPGRRVLALTSGAESPAQIAALLVANGFGATLITVLERLGGPGERIRRIIACEDVPDDVDPLNVVALEVEAAPDARILPLAGGLADALFENDGQITRFEVRALTLAALAPRRGDLLWDIGAGSGSIAISFLLADPSLRACAIESDPMRAARIARNAAACGVPHLAIVQGRAPAALAGLARPDCIFVGGGGRAGDLMDAAQTALKPGGRLVVNAVTLETEADLLARHARLGGDLVRIALARAEPVGGLTGWRPAMPITQWRWVKP
ncbi:MAG: cobalamin biosynthesis bifunctional protein CbiET [Rhizobiales bacterium 32-66-8]|nr:MAG: cobalamin biosynthesis bifunctional protein CbiET [Rhizobiales bacterium 32-66-8]